MRRDPDEGRLLADVLGRAAMPSREERAAELAQPDPDDRTAALLTRGYRPGQLSQLSQRLGDVSAELEAEREKLERGARRSEQVRQLHEAGRLTAWQVMQQLDGDFGDEARVRQLQRQQASLQSQIEQAHEAASPPRQRELDGVEAAAQRAHQIFTEVTRQRMAEAQARRPEPRPFAGRGSADAADECTGPDCPVCQWGRAAGRGARQPGLRGYRRSRDRAMTAPLPPVSPGDPNTPERRLAEPQGGERDPADVWGADYDAPLPSVGGSPTGLIQT